MGQAAERYKADNNVVSLSESRLRNNDAELTRFMNRYFKVVKNCNGSYAPCFADTYETIGGSDIPMRDYSCAFTGVLASGVAVCADAAAASSTPADRDVNGDGKIDENDVIKNDGVRAGAVITFEVDVNGAQGPNIGGRDLFRMDVTADGQVIDTGYVSGTSPADANGGIGIGRILDDGWQMNY